MTGVVQTTSLQIALLQDASGKALRIPKDAMYLGWKLVSVEPHQVIFEQGADRTKLSFAGSKDKLPPGDLVAVPATTTAAIPAPAPMITTDAKASVEPVASGDDAAIRQARMDALKKIVTERRKGLSPTTGSP
ncbi:hypothetical protein [Dyella mobilis]|uniref:Uncharacterized protein n=1 Tax=Dyella mobilis TaxID=1849582 RepID=A0ABS2KEU2_9GAMM|nr:hypothetical protein [Dyella mobilis]MBM7129697.1 hypothetical protein [Dyella mobilis]